MKLLVDLYKILSKSNNEEDMSKYVSNFLTKHKIKHEKTKDLQLYNIKPNRPMICAHMDQVGTTQVTNIYMIDNYISGNYNIGADDKNGIFILLYLLLEFRDKVSFIFSTGEETGCNIFTILSEIKKDILEKISYCLVFDRQKSSDIIGYKNDYCNLDLENDIEEIGKKYEFQSESGLISDCDILSMYGIPSVNLSCGYYQPHSNYEFTDLEELRNSYEFGREILNTLTKTYSRVEEKRRRNYYFGHYYEGYYEDYYDNYTPKPKIKSKEYKKNNVMIGDITSNVIPNSTNLYKCFKCDFIFTKEDINDILACPICYESIKEIKTYPTEKPREEERYDEIFYCVDCNKYYTFENRINENLFCPECFSILYIDYFFLVASNYIQRKDVVGADIYCPKCRKKYIIKDSDTVGTCPECKSITFIDSTYIDYNTVEEIFSKECNNIFVTEHYCPTCDKYFELPHEKTGWHNCPQCKSMLIEDSYYCNTEIIPFY